MGSLISSCVMLRAMRAYSYFVICVFDEFRHDFVSGFVNDAACDFLSEFANVNDFVNAFDHDFVNGCVNTREVSRRKALTPFLFRLNQAFTKESNL